MYTPWLVGLVSIIPGLGFWLIHQRRRALGAIILVIGFFVIYYLASHFSWWQPLIQFFRYVAFTLWVGQMVFAADTARLINERAKKPSKAVRRSGWENTTPPGLNRRQRFIYRTRALVNQQLDNGDKLIAAVMGTYLAERKDGVSIQFPMRTRYVGLTDRIILQIELDLLGDPMLVERLPIEGVKKADFRQGILTDALRIELNEDKIIEMKVPFQLREETKVMASELAKNKAV
jgi:hypothetical protein